MKAVLDTNVVISAIFFGGDPRRIVRAARCKRIELVATQAVIAEYREVAERLHQRYPTVGYRRPLAILESLLTLVRPATLKGRVSRDSDDDAFIACAVGAKAKLICSGDDDLLSVRREKVGGESRWRWTLVGLHLLWKRRGWNPRPTVDPAIYRSGNVDDGRVVPRGMV